MRWTNRVLMRLRSLMRRDRVEHEIDAELRFHLDRQIEENIAGGMTAQDAQRAAMRSVGSLIRIKEECRESLGLRVLDQCRQDVTYAIRTLTKSRAFTLVAILTLAPCIGANTALFTIVNDVLLRPLRIPESDRVLLIYNSYPKAGVVRASATAPDYFERKRD